MKLKDLFRKKTTPVNSQATFKPEPVKRIIPTALARNKNGDIKEIPYGTILRGECLIAPDGEYFHTYVGCYATCPEWELVTIKEAKERGYMPCLICEDKLREAQTFYTEDEDE